VTASLPVIGQLIASDLPGVVVAASEVDLFRIEPPVEKVNNVAGLSLKILVNWAPVYSGSLTMREADIDALLSALRAIAHQAAVVAISLTVFSTQEMCVVYRQPNSGEADFPAIGNAIRTLNPRTVHISAIARKHPKSVFLTDLISAELRTDDDTDAIVFVSSG
jgi:hypothetical protein